jgi:hypothetical protein
MVSCLEALPQIDHQSLTGRNIHMCGYMCVYILSNTYIWPPWLRAHWRSQCFEVQYCHRVRTARNGNGQRQRYIAFWLYTHRHTQNTHRETHNHTHTNTETLRHKHTETQTHKYRQKHKHTYTHTNRHAHKHRNSHRHTNTNANPNIDTNANIDTNTETQTLKLTQTYKHKRKPKYRHKHRNTNTDTKKHTQDRIMRASSDVTLNLFVAPVYVEQSTGSGCAGGGAVRALELEYLDKILDWGRSRSRYIFSDSDADSDCTALVASFRTFWLGNLQERSVVTSWRTGTWGVYKPYGEPYKTITYFVQMKGIV